MGGRLLVTGCGGFVGGGIIHEAGSEWEIHGVTLEESQIVRPGLVWHTMDLQDADRTRALFAEHRFDAVIHAAALADIDFCQANQEAAYKVNVGITRMLADLCSEFGTKMVYMSTDTVFGGEKGMYVEDDPPRPLNYYAETKVEAEGIVLGLPNAVVERTSLVMGLPMLGAGNSFLSRMIPLFEQNKLVGVPDNEIRTPIDVVTLSRALLELAGNTFAGLIHLSGNDRMSRYEMTQRLARRLGYPVDLVVVKNAEASPDRAPRPVDASLCNERAKSVLVTPMVGLEEGLDIVLTAKGLRSKNR